MPYRSLAFALLFALSSAAVAQTAPTAPPLRQAEFYFDEDASTLRPVLNLKDRSPAGIERLTRTIERRPDGSLLESAQLGHYAMQSGQADVGRDLYARALARIDQNNGLWRPVKWTYGWDLYRAGDARGALQQWSELVNRGTTASWMPTTLALVLWKLDRRAEAVQWYAAAVRTEPRSWSTPDRFDTLLPAWRAEERALLAQVQAAWAAAPPAWPSR